FFSFEIPLALGPRRAGQSSPETETVSEITTQMKRMIRWRSTDAGLRLGKESKKRIAPIVPAERVLLWN
ncbi:MAG: hypothetical protein KGQ60_19505, partial [Planctomycetes bacterium]|nr:hypothetical protein [Planctomycetota bacterium]